MKLLAIDAGSSSVRAAVLHNGKLSGPITRAAFSTRYEGTQAEVQPDDILRAVREAVRQLGSTGRRVEAIALTNMAPSWVAMDARGRPLTPIVTHQDRRSIEIARELEQLLGQERFLQITGNRPFPGGISSTTFAWFLRYQRPIMRKADLVGHLNTFLHRQFTGARVTDPSNASFMGLYHTLRLDGWSAELCDAIGVPMRRLPEVLESNRIGGRLTQTAADELGLVEGTPMMVGLMDTSAAMLLSGAKPGQLLNVSGSTDVLAVCTDHPRPQARLLTRALGIGRRWMSVSTLAAAGSALAWVKDQLFADYSIERYHELLARLAGKPLGSSVRFEPYLAGDRLSIEQRQAAFSGLTLATTRQEMLSAVIEALAQASAQRLPLLRQGQTHLLPTVIVSGGVQASLHRILHRDWPGTWRFRNEEEATLRGLGTLTPI